MLIFASTNIIWNNNMYAAEWTLFSLNLFIRRQFIDILALCGLKFFSSMNDNKMLHISNTIMKSVRLSFGNMPQHSHTAQWMPMQNQRTFLLIFGFMKFTRNTNKTSINHGKKGETFQYGYFNWSKTKSDHFLSYYLLWICFNCYM